MWFYLGEKYKGVFESAQRKTSTSLKQFTKGVRGVPLKEGPFLGKAN